MGSDHSSVRSSCFYGVYSETYPQDDGLVNYYDFGRFWPYDSDVNTGKYSDEKFCERWGEPYAIHEYINAFSALFMCVIGILLLSWDHRYGDIRFVSGCIFVNGIASFCNHWFATRDWMIMDNSSMFIPVYVLFASIFDELRALTPLPNAPAYAVSFRPLSSACVWIFLCVGPIWTLVYLNMNGCDMTAGSFLSDVGFAVPLVAIIPLIYTHIPKLNVYMEEHFGGSIDSRPIGKRSIDYYKEAKSRFTFGVAICFISAVTWIFNEKLFCPLGRSWVPYIPAHAFWHIFMSYGFYNLLIFLVCLKSIAAQIRRGMVDRNSQPTFPTFQIKTVHERILKTYCFPTFDGWLNKALPIPITRLRTSDDKWNPQTVKKCFTDCCGGGCCFCIRDCFCPGPVPHTPYIESQLNVKTTTGNCVDLNTANDDVEIIDALQDVVRAKTRKSSSIL